jgi:endonuclease YncB( thermonuclease family)
MVDVMRHALALPIISLLTLLVPGLPALAARAPAPVPCARIAGGGGEVAEIAGPLTFKLKDGAEIALSEIGLPARPAGAAYPASDAAREALKAAILGKSVGLYFEAKPALREDRHRRLLAQVLVREGGAPYWLQARLVEEGAALVDSWETNRACAAALLQLEAAARKQERGLWSDAANSPLPAERAGEARGRFALVEGQIVSARKIGGRIYLDFAPDWREALAVTIEGRAARRFLKAKLDPLALEGRRVRVRGFVDWGSGPVIAVTHPEMIEVLSSPVAAQR